jgi:hypothetical protein
MHTIQKQNNSALKSESLRKFWIFPCLLLKDKHNPHESGRKCWIVDNTSCRNCICVASTTYVSPTFCYFFSLYYNTIWLSIINTLLLLFLFELYQCVAPIKRSSTTRLLYYWLSYERWLYFIRPLTTPETKKSVPPRLQSQHALDHQRNRKPLANCTICGLQHKD